MSIHECPSYFFIRREFCSLFGCLKTYEQVHRLPVATGQSRRTTQLQTALEISLNLGKFFIQSHFQNTIVYEKMEILII